MAVAGLVVVAACGSSQNGGFPQDGGSPSSDSSTGSSSGSSSSGSSSGGNSSGSFGDGGLPEAQPVTTGDPKTCAEATQSHSYIGCDYWPTVTTNIVWSLFDFAVVVANAGTDTANITVTGPGAFSQMATAAPGGLATIYLPWVTNLKGPDANECGGWAFPGTMDGASGPLANSVLEKGGAYHLVSSVPVTVYQFNALEYQGQGGPSGKDWSQCPGSTKLCSLPGQFPTLAGCFSFTNDASLLLPSTAMTGNVRVVSRPGINPTPIPMAGTYPGVSAFAAITATANNTNVTVTVSGTGSILASANGTDIAATNAGGVLKFTMNAGDVAELTSPQSDMSDLSGSLVQANNPIQVITGTACITLPEQAPACDHTEESNFPAETLGKDYIVAQPMGPEGNVVGHSVRIYGNVNGTNLTYSPSAPPNCPSTINAGQVVECGSPLGNACPQADMFGNITYTAPCGNGNIVTQDFEVTGDHEFAVSTFSQGASLIDKNSMTGAQQGDPDQSLATAVKQYRTKYVFLAPTDYMENYAVIVAPMGTTISIDGTPQSVTFTPVGSNGFGVMRVPLAAGNAGAHVLVASNPVGLQVMGYGSYTSYTYPGGSDLTLIAPPPPPPQ
jgi:hypothetical protein